MKPKLLAMPADNGGCGHYRIFLPAKTIARNHISEWVVESNVWFDPNKLARLNPTHIVCQRQTEESQYAALKVTKLFGKAIIIYDLDDLLWEVPTYNSYKKYFKVTNKKILRSFLVESDVVTCSTEPLAEEIKKLSGVTPEVLPNQIRGSDYRLPQKRTGDKLRVGWAGSATHKDDLSLMENAITQSLDKVEWHFLGYIPSYLKGKVVEHPYVPVDQYVQSLHSLNLDVAIAPLQVNRFNECKSNLKLIEFGAIGLPVITTDVYPYGYNPGIKIKNGKNAWQTWLEAILLYANDENKRMEDAINTFEYAAMFSLDIPMNITRIASAWQMHRYKNSYSFLQKSDLSVVSGG